MTPKQIEAEFKIERKTIYYWCRNGDIIFFKKNKKLLIPISHLEKFLENNLIDKRDIT